MLERAWRKPFLYCRHIMVEHAGVFWYTVTVSVLKSMEEKYEQEEKADYRHHYSYCDWPDCLILWAVFSAKKCTD